MHSIEYEITLNEQNCVFCVQIQCKIHSTNTCVVSFYYLLGRAWVDSNFSSCSFTYIHDMYIILSCFQSINWPLTLNNNQSINKLTLDIKQQSINKLTLDIKQQSINKLTLDIKQQSINQSIKFWSCFYLYVWLFLF